MEIYIGGKRVACNDLKDARKKWVAHRDGEGIGASDMKRNDGKVFDGKTLIATVSYNGRVWNPDGSEAT